MTQLTFARTSVTVRMVYLDSLYNGVGALTAFTRFTNFLERVFVSQSKVIDWKEWQYYVIPSTEI